MAGSLLTVVWHPAVIVWICEQADKFFPEVLRVLEVGAGSGRLAAHLTHGLSEKPQARVSLLATDLFTAGLATTDTEVQVRQF